MLTMVIRNSTKLDAEKRLALQQEKEALEHAVEVDLEEFVPVVDGFLELVGNFHGLRELRHVRVDEH